MENDPELQLGQAPISMQAEQKYQKDLALQRGLREIIGARAEDHGLTFTEGDITLGQVKDVVLAELDKELANLHQLNNGKAAKESHRKHESLLDETRIKISTSSDIVEILRLLAAVEDSRPKLYSMIKNIKVSADLRKLAALGREQ